MARQKKREFVYNVLIHVSQLDQNAFQAVLDLRCDAEEEELMRRAVNEEG